MDLRCKVEIVNRRHQQPRLPNDLLGALAISTICRAEILAFDDFGEPDDRVQRRLDLVDQLSKRIGIREQFLGLAGLEAILLTQRNAPVSGESPVGRFKSGYSADLPFAGEWTV